MPEPLLRAGLITSTSEVSFFLDGRYHLLLPQVDGGGSPGTVSGEIRANAIANSIIIHNHSGELARGSTIRLEPLDPRQQSFRLFGVPVGLDFHWEQRKNLRYRGLLSLEPGDRTTGEGGLQVVNELGLETYLESVVASEMSPHCPAALLEAHAIVSRSWLIAQVEGTRAPPLPPTGIATESDGTTRIIRWYDREDHGSFHVCADDHCQRYQGLPGSGAQAAESAVRTTRGTVLEYEGRVCDARFSKCCGGVTEIFSSAWGDQDLPYLRSFPDSPSGAAVVAHPLSGEQAARDFIRQDTPAWCNTRNRDLLERILPRIDHGTTNFYRWELFLPQDRLRSILDHKLGMDVGPVISLKALRRGPSSRIVELEIHGKRNRLVVGKELEIRRILSESHLYSSAFTIQPTPGSHGIPSGFKLRGAGWGHGVGLCQIGAAVMAWHSHGYRSILSHYYRGAVLRKRY